MRSQRGWLPVFGRRLACGRSTLHRVSPQNCDALIVLAAGDLAVLTWWMAIFLFVYRRPQWKWALVGPSLMTAIVLVTWFASAVLTPLGRADLGASDAAKFLAISGVSPWMLAVIICGIAGITAALVTRYFRLPASTAT